MCCSRSRRATHVGRGVARLTGRVEPPRPEDGLAQAPGLRVLRVSDPRTYLLFDLWSCDGAVPPAVPEASQTVAEAADVCFGQTPTTPWEQNESQEGGRFADGRQMRLLGVKPQPPTLQIPLDPPPPFVELIQTVVKSGSEVQRRGRFRGHRPGSASPSRGEPSSLRSLRFASRSRKIRHRRHSRRRRPGGAAPWTPVQEVKRQGCMAQFMARATRNPKTPYR